MQLNDACLWQGLMHSALMSFLEETGGTLHTGVYTEVLARGEAESKDLRWRLARPLEISGAVINELLKLCQHLLHLRDCARAVYQLADLWMGQLVGCDEGEQCDGLPSPSWHLDHEGCLSCSDKLRCPISSNDKAG